MQQTTQDKSLFAFSAGSKAKTIEQLMTNLTVLINEARKGSTTEKKLNKKPLLVNKHIKHRFNDAWYYGHILSVVPGFTDWYNVKYDNDEAIYVYKLQEDYEQGDLVIVPQRTDMLNFSPKRSQFRFYLHVTASVDDLHVLTSCFCYIWGYCLNRLKAGNDTLQFFVCLN